MPNNVIDLDILRPEEKIIKIGGKEIDISFIPCALTFDIDEIVRDLSKLNLAKVQKNDGAETKKAFDLSIKLCSIFCVRQHPECTEKWFQEKTSVQQVQKFAEEIKSLLTLAYAGAEEYGKNAEAVKN